MREKRFHRENLIPERTESLIKLILGHLKSLNYDLRQTIVLSGSPRGGTTWVAEILSTIPRSSLLFEPLHLKWNPELKQIGFRWHTYIPPGLDWPEAEKYLRRALKGRILHAGTLRQVGLKQLWQTKVWIVKFTRGNLLLKWLTEKFRIRTPILLIRHPCAVVASQLVHPRFRNPGPPLSMCPEFATIHPQFDDLLKSLETPEERLAARWCMQYYAPLSLPKPHPWRLTAYEKLVRDGGRELEQMFRIWGLEVPSEARSRLSRPSATTAKESNVYKGKDPLYSWRERLSSSQVKRILNVVGAFGLDFYSEELEPNYERFNQYTHP